MSQYRRWGMLPEGVDYAAISQEVMRPDIYEDAMQEIDYDHGGANMEPETLFDGVTFDPSKPEDYAAGFEIHSMKG
jgi:nitrate/nitrite transport system substrate-binding protein